MTNQHIVQTPKDKLFVEMQNFGEWLRQQLIAKRMSNAELARLTKVSPTHVGNLIRNFSPNTKSGVGKPSRELAISIAKALDADVNEVLLLAGYSPEVIHEDGLIIAGFDGLDRDDIEKIKSYIAFLKSQKSDNSK